jgi:hypothetical protein
MSSAACACLSRFSKTRSPRSISFADIVTSTFAMGPPLRPRGVAKRGHFYMGQRGHLVWGLYNGMSDNRYYVNYVAFFSGAKVRPPQS